MTQQKALLLTEKHGSFEFGLVEKPTPGPGEILVKIIATALNPADWKIQVTGLFFEKYPAILGSDCAGIVEEVGEGVTRFKVEDKVFHQGYYSQNRNGTFQQYTIVLAEIAAKIPDNISFEEASTIPVGLAAAATGFYGPLETNVGLGLTPPWEGGEGKYKDQGVLIFGGSSSVGQYAIQLAKLSGFNPIVTTASLHNIDFLKSLGATHVIDRKTDIVAETAKIFTTPPKIVYDAISDESTELAAWKILAPGGSLVLVLPPVPGIEKGADGKTFVYIFGSVFIHRELGISMYAHLTEYLATEKLKPNNKVEVLPNGLAGIRDGLRRLQNNEVSALKLIAKPQETP